MMYISARLNIAIVLTLLTIIFSSTTFAVEVDVDEITSTKRVKFINYKGINKKIDPVQGIVIIGGKLGKAASQKPVNQKIRYHMKYSIVRAISKNEPDKFSADIFYIDKNAKVNHIKNVRRILSGYFMEMYGYSNKDAYTLALFTTYYNAVYRSNIDYFSEKYKGIVLKWIEKKKAGISTKYYEWPGSTEILIPLTDQAKRGKLNAIDPDIISDKKVRKEVRKDIKNLDERKDLVDIKERIVAEDKEELVKEEKELIKEKEEVKKEKESLAEEKEDLQQQKDDLKKEETKLADEKEIAKTIDEPEARKAKEKEIAEKEKIVTKKREETKRRDKKIEDKKTKITKKEKKIKDKETKITKREESIDKKKKIIEEEKKEIAEDELKKDITDDPELAKDKLEEKAEVLKIKEDKLDEREDKLRDKELDKNIYGLSLYYLKIKEYLAGGHYNNEMYMIDPATRKILFKSRIDNICGKRYDVFSKGVAVITHLGNHVSGHRLTLLDRKTLSPINTGSEDVFWRSFIEIRDGFIYVIMEENQQYYLGKYDQDLRLIAKSNQWINENTFISFYQDYIYINRHDKKIMVLNKKDLSILEIVKPGSD